MAIVKLTRESLEEMRKRTPGVDIVSESGINKKDDETFLKFSS